MNGTKYILLAEDDTEDYLFFTAALEKISPFTKIVRAKNGFECMDLLKEREKPDLIFLDLKMPGRNGFEILKLIKDNDQLSHIPVVIYSTSHYMKDIDACYKNNAHYYIIKPADADKLVDILTEVFLRLNDNADLMTKENFVIGLRFPVSAAS